ncbi:MAG: hypothetical protein ACQERN_11475 [Thermodesulfobacteriota bacterium]
MIRAGFRLIFLVLLMISVSGCSSVLTYFGPLKSKLADGDTHVGEFAEYDYQLQGQFGILYVAKTPMCKQLVQKLRVAQKQRRGVYMAIIEMPFFGLGLFDLLRSYAIVEESRKVEPLARYHTGKLMACNGQQPAAEESFVIRNKARQISITAKTNAEGALNLAAVLPDDFSSGTLEIQPESAPDTTMTYQYPAVAPIE